MQFAVFLFEISAPVRGVIISFGEDGNSDHLSKVNTHLRGVDPFVQGAVTFPTSLQSLTRSQIEDIK